MIGREFDFLDKMDVMELTGTHVGQGHGKNNVADGFEALEHVMTWLTRL